MKKHLSLLCIFLILIFAFSSCNKTPKEMKAGDVQKLLQKLNTNPFGIKIQAKDKNISTRMAELEDDCDGFVITLTNPDFTFDTSAMIELYPVMKKIVIPFQMKEMTLSYDYPKKKLGLLSFNEWTMELNLLDLVDADEKKGGEGVNPSSATVKFSTEKMEMKNYNISALLNSGEKTAKDFLLQLWEDNPNAHSIASNMELKMALEKGANDKIEFSLTSERLEGHQTMRSDFFTSWFTGQLTAEKAERLMAGGMPMFHTYGKLLNSNFFVSAMGKEVAVGNLWQLDFANFLKPDEQGKFFQYGFFYNVKQLRSAIPALGGMEQLLANFKELNLNFIIEHLTPEVVAEYMNIAAINFSDKYKDKEAREQALALKLMEFAPKMFASRPIFKLTVLPFRSHFGELNLDSSFQFIDAGWPQGKATVRVKDMDKVASNIKEDDFIEDAFKKKLILILNEYFLPDPKNTGVLTFEIESGKPGQLILNGKPLKK